MKESTKMECLECDEIFYKKIGKHTVEVRCPKCGSDETEIICESFEDKFSGVGSDYDFEY